MSNVVRYKDDLPQGCCGGQYNVLGNMTTYLPPKTCLSRFNIERTAWDKMLQEKAMHGKYPHFPSASKQFQHSWGVIPKE